MVLSQMFSFAPPANTPIGGSLYMGQVPVTGPFAAREIRRMDRTLTTDQPVPMGEGKTFQGSPRHPPEWNIETGLLLGDRPGDGKGGIGKPLTSFESLSGLLEASGTPCSQIGCDWPSTHSTFTLTRRWCPR